MSFLREWNLRPLVAPQHRRPPPQPSSRPPGLPRHEALARPPQRPPRSSKQRDVGYVRHGHPLSRDPEGLGWQDLPRRRAGPRPPHPWWSRGARRGKSKREGGSGRKWASAGVGAVIVNEGKWGGGLHQSQSVRRSAAAARGGRKVSRAARWRKWAYVAALGTPDVRQPWPRAEARVPGCILAVQWRPLAIAGEI